MSATAVGAFARIARRTMDASKRATRRMRCVTVVYSITGEGEHDSFVIVSQLISLGSGPEGPATRIGNVRATSTTSVSVLVAIPISLQSAPAVVSRLVTKG